MQYILSLYYNKNTKSMDNFKLDFLIVGFQKCGTSTLSDYLSRHKEINFCSTKEPAYFLKQYHVLHKFNSYKALYNGQKIGLKGEASTAYGFVKHCGYTAKALFEHNPDMKLIFIVRNPVHRVLSVMRHSQFQNSHIQDSTWYQRTLEKGIENSNYGEVLNTYLQYFSLENILIVKFEELINEVEFHKICNFLNISHYKDMGLRKVNFTPQKYVKGKWFTFYKKYHFFFLQLPFSQSLRRISKTLLYKKKKPSNVELIQLDNKDKEKIEKALIKDACRFKEIAGFNYFDLKK